MFFIHGKRSFQVYSGRRCLNGLFRGSQCPPLRQQLQQREEDNNGRQRAVEEQRLRAKQRVRAELTRRRAGLLSGAGLSRGIYTQ